jgi:hypothetical protein
MYYLLTFAWVVGINTTLAIFLTPLYNFGPLQIGYFYFTPIVAALLGEITGHWLHDFIASSYIRKHEGHFEPEVRLRAMWVSTPFILAGLVGLGFCLEDGYHYMVTSLFWGLYVFGIMITTVGLNAYNLDSYPEASGETASWVNFCRTVSPYLASLLFWAISTNERSTDWWLHHLVLSSDMGECRRHQDQLRHPGSHLRLCLRHHRVPAVLRQKTEALVRTAGLCDVLRCAAWEAQ